METKWFLKIWLVFVNFEKFTFMRTASTWALQTLDGDWSRSSIIEVNFSKQTHSKNIFRNNCVCLYDHICKISSQIIECKILAPYHFLKWAKEPPAAPLHLCECLFRHREYMGVEVPHVLPPVGGDGVRPVYGQLLVGVDGDQHDTCPHSQHKGYGEIPDGKQNNKIVNKNKNYDNKKPKK